jgi:hypothetical protein
MAAKQGPNILFCMPNSANCILLVSVTNRVWGGAVKTSPSPSDSAAHPPLSAAACQVHPLCPLRPKTASAKHCGTHALQTRRSHHGKRQHQGSTIYLLVWSLLSATLVTSEAQRGGGGTLMERLEKSMHSRIHGILDELSVQSWASTSSTRRPRMSKNGKQICVPCSATCSCTLQLL